MAVPVCRRVRVCVRVYYVCVCVLSSKFFIPVHTSESNPFNLRQNIIMSS